MRFALLLSFGLARAQSTDPVVVGKTFIAEAIDPIAGSNGWSLTSHGISENLFTVDKHGEIVPVIAESCTMKSEFVWEVTLKSGYKFSDGTAVTAAQVATCINELSAGNPSSQASAGTLTATALSDSKVSITTERATHTMSSILAEWVHPIYLKDSSGIGGPYLFTGPYKVANFVAGNFIDIVPNTHYFQANKRLPIKLKKFASGDELATALAAGEIDLAFHLPVTKLPTLRSTAGVHVKSFEVGYHFMMFHNMDNSVCADKHVREAIDLAIDRTELTGSTGLQGGHGTRSLFPDFTPWYSDSSDPKGAASAAEAKLDAAGWALVGGKRMKDGQELKIKLIDYSSRPGLGLMQPLIGASLTALGITVSEVTVGDPECPDWSFTDTGDFDLLMWAQNTLPAGDPAWFLNSFFRSTGGNNLARFSSTSVDGLLDDMAGVGDHTARVAASAAAHDAILAEVPVSNLATPEWHVGMSDRMNAFGYEPYGSDYYVINAHLFVPHKSYGVEDSSESVSNGGSGGVDSGSTLAGAFALCIALLF